MHQSYDAQMASFSQAAGALKGSSNKGGSRRSKRWNKKKSSGDSSHHDRDGDSPAADRSPRSSSGSMPDHMYAFAEVVDKLNQIQAELRGESAANTERYHEEKKTI